MSSSKGRRRVTVDQEHPLPGGSGSSRGDMSAEKRKPSVFERLGAPSRGFEQQDICREFVRTGHCNYGSSCKYSHPSRRKDREQEDLRHRVSRKREHSEDREGSGSENEHPKKRDRGSHKDKSMKSAVVVKGGESDYEEALHDDSDLDFESTLLLMKKRQQLQQQLSMLEEAEKAEADEKEGFTVERQVSELEDSEGEYPQVLPPQHKRHRKGDSGDRQKTREKKKKKKKDKDKERGGKMLSPQPVAPPPPPMQPEERPEKIEKPKRHHSKEHSKSKLKSPEGKVPKHSDRQQLAETLTMPERPKHLSSKSISRERSPSPSPKKKSSRDKKKRDVERSAERPPVDRKSRWGSPTSLAQPELALAKSKDTKKGYEYSTPEPTGRSESKSSKTKSKRSVSPGPQRVQSKERDHSAQRHSRQEPEPPVKRAVSSVSPTRSQKDGSSRRYMEERAKYSKERTAEQPRGRKSSKDGRKAKTTRPSSSSSSSSSSSESSSSSSSDSSSSESSSSSDSSPERETKKPKWKTGSSPQTKDRRKRTKGRRSSSGISTEGKPRRGSASPTKGKHRTSSKDKGKISRKDDRGRDEREGERTSRTREEPSAVRGRRESPYDPRQAQPPSLPKSQDRMRSSQQDRSKRECESGRGMSRERGAERKREEVWPKGKEDRDKYEQLRQGQSPDPSKLPQLAVDKYGRPLREDYYRAGEREALEAGRAREGEAERDHTRERDPERDRERYGDRYTDPQAVQQYADQRSALDYHSREGYIREEAVYAERERARDRSDRDRYDRTQVYDERYAERRDDSRSRQDYQQVYRDERTGEYYQYATERAPEDIDKDRGRGLEQKGRILEERVAEPERYDDRDRYKVYEPRTHESRPSDTSSHSTLHSGDDRKTGRDWKPSKDRSRDDWERERSLGGSARDKASIDLRRADEVYGEGKRELGSERQSRRQQWEEKDRGDVRQREYDDRARDSASRRRGEEEAVRSPSTRRGGRGSPSSSSSRGLERGDRGLERGERDYGRNLEYVEVWRGRREEEERRGWDRERDERRGQGEEGKEADYRDRKQDKRESQPKMESDRGDKKRHLSPSWEGSEHDKERKRQKRDWEQEDTRRSTQPEGAWPEEVRPPAELRGEWPVVEKELMRGGDDRRSTHDYPVDPPGLRPEYDDRARRSPSRSSLGSRHSYRDRDREDRLRSEQYREDYYRAAGAEYSRSRGGEDWASRDKDREREAYHAQERGYDRSRDWRREGREAEPEVVPPVYGVIAPDAPKVRDERDRRGEERDRWENRGRGEDRRAESRDREGERYWKEERQRGDRYAAGWEREEEKAARQETDTRYREQRSSDRGTPAYEDRYGSSSRGDVAPPKEEAPPPVVPLEEETPPVDSATPASPPEGAQTQAEETPSTVEADQSSPAEAGAPVDGNTQSPEYDEISEDELDDIIGEAESETEEKDKALNVIVDALGIDWKSLQNTGSSTKRPPVAGSALKRFSPAAVFCRLGISPHYAGAALVEKVTGLCKQHVEEEDQENKERNQEALETGNKDNGGIEDQTLSMKPEQQPDSTAASEAEKQAATKPQVEVKLSVYGVNRGKTRTNSLCDIGPFRRALCARRDLAIRRKLCKVDKIAEGTTLYPVSIVDQELYKQSLQLFRQDRIPAAAQQNKSADTQAITALC